MSNDDGEERRSGLRSFLTARALFVTAMRAVLIGGALLCLMLLDPETSKQPGGEVAAFSAFLLVAIALALGPTSLLEVRAAEGPPPGRGALAGAWALSVVGVVLLLVQLVYALALLETRSLDGAFHAVVDSWSVLQVSASPEDLAGLLMFVVVVPTCLSIVSAIRLGRVSRGMRTLFTILTFPSGLVALGAFGAVDSLERLLFSRTPPAPTGEEESGASAPESSPEAPT
jgi:hypothetical protein